MAETILSPGVLLRETDTTQLTQGIQTMGAAVVGPTVKGPVNIPTIVTSYSEYLLKFGGSFTSNNQNDEYLTSISAQKYFEQGGDTLSVTRVVSGTFTEAQSVIGSTNNTASFTLETISSGVVMNNSGSEGTNNILPLGSGDNIRWEIPSINVQNGTFNLIIRRGNDSSKSKTILESWSNLSLDPNSPNYIESVIGNQKPLFMGDYIQYNGEYKVKSNYVRVASVTGPTYEYFDNNGIAKSSLTGSIPVVSSGSFSGAQGTLFGSSTISSSLPHNAYTSSLFILGNKEEYVFDILTIPGKTQINDPATVALAISVCQNRGDAIAVVDVSDKGTNISTAISKATEIDSSYAAAYYPWVQVISPNSGKLVWVPPSTIIPSVYAYNDRVSAEWFAPAGFKRGGISVVQAERKLSTSNRDDLYLGKINPIGTFPGQGIVVYGQKTLQAKSSATDRIGVRRLLIELKRYIGQVGNGLVFEQNTQSTRNAFLAKVNPYLDSVQQRQGLYSKQVVMNDSNNGSDVIDRNQLVGQIIIQPTRTVEFVVLDFNVTPTGTSFE